MGTQLYLSPCYTVGTTTKFHWYTIATHKVRFPSCRQTPARCWLRYCPFGHYSTAIAPYTHTWLVSYRSHKHRPPARADTVKPYRQPFLFILPAAQHHRIAYSHAHALTQR